MPARVLVSHERESGSDVSPEASKGSTRAKRGMCVNVCSAGCVESTDDELVDAELLFGGFDGEASVQRVTDS